MKKLSLYIFLVLMWCNVGFAEDKILYCSMYAFDKFNEDENFKKDTEPRKFKITTNAKISLFIN